MQIALLGKECNDSVSSALSREDVYSQEDKLCLVCIH